MILSNDFHTERFFTTFFQSGPLKKSSLLLLLALQVQTYSVIATQFSRPSQQLTHRHLGEAWGDRIIERCNSRGKNKKKMIRCLLCCVSNTVYQSLYSVITTQYYTELLSTTQYYSVLHSTTEYYSTITLCPTVGFGGGRLIKGVGEKNNGSCFLFQTPISYINQDPLPNNRKPPNRHCPTVAFLGFRLI